MKKFIFGLIALIAFSVNGFAGNNVEKYAVYSPDILVSHNGSVVIVNVDGNTTTTYTFNAWYTLCDVTVTVSVGVSQTYASLTVTIKDIDCKTVVAEAKKMKKQLEEALAS